MVVRSVHWAMKHDGTILKVWRTTNLSLLQSLREGVFEFVGTSDGLGRLCCALSPHPGASRARAGIPMRRQKSSLKAWAVRTAQLAQPALRHLSGNHGLSSLTSGLGGNLVRRRFPRVLCRPRLSCHSGVQIRSASRSRSRPSASMKGGLLLVEAVGIRHGERHLVLL